MSTGRRDDPHPGRAPSSALRPLDPLRCGGCRGDVFKLTHVRTSNGDSVPGRFWGYVAITCVGCGAVSELRPEPATLRMDWAADNEKGVICGGWPEPEGGAAT